MFTHKDRHAPRWPGLAWCASASLLGALTFLPMVSAAPDHSSRLLSPRGYTLDCKPQQHSGVPVATGDLRCTLPLQANARQPLSQHARPSRKPLPPAAPTSPRRPPDDKPTLPTYDLLPGRWDDRFTVAGFSGPDGLAPVIFDMARTPKGKLLAVGSFEFVGDQSVRGLAELGADGWRADRTKWDRTVTRWGFSALAVSEQGALALSTYAGSFGGPNEIWLSVRDRIQVIGQFQGSIRSLVWFKGRLWAAGVFRLANEVTHLAVWDGATWSAAPGGPADEPVFRLSVSGSSLFAIGNFTSIGGIAAEHVAEWNGSHWRAYDLNVPTAHAYSVLRTRDGRLLAGGAIAGGIVEWNGSGWEPLQGGVYVADRPGVVTDMVEHKGHLYVTGCFSSAHEPVGGKAAVLARNIARWNSSQGWEGLDDGSKPVGAGWFTWGVCGGEPNPYSVWDVTHQRLFSDEDHLYLGGFFGGIAGVASQALVSFDGARWQAAGRTRDGVFGNIKRIAASPNNDVYVLGDMSHAGRTPAHGLKSRYSVFRRAGSGSSHRDTWTLVGGPIPDNLSCEAIAVDRRGDVYVGCVEVGMSSPTDPGGSGPGGPGGEDPTPPKDSGLLGALAASKEEPVVFRLTGGSWQRLSTEGLKGSIYDIRVDTSGVLWIAGGSRGAQSNDGSQQGGSGFIARLDHERFNAVEASFDSIVFKIAFSPVSCNSCPPDLVAAGAFSSIGGQPFSRVARLKGNQWQALGKGSKYDILALAWNSRGIYASSQLPSDAPAADADQWIVGHWNGKRWTELATPENGMPALLPGSYRWMADLIPYGDKVIAVGSFLPMGTASPWPGAGAGNALVVDGPKVSVLGGGVHAIYLSTAAIVGNELWFGGLSLAEVGAGKERTPSVGVAHFLPREH